MNLGAYQCWDGVSFVKGLCLIAWESKQGVTILLYIDRVWLETPPKNVMKVHTHKKKHSPKAGRNTQYTTDRVSKNVKRYYTCII